MDSERGKDTGLGETITTGGGKKGRPSELRFASASERYRMGKVLGKGGMGEVVTATDAQIGREVAIKRMALTSEQAIARFVREARIQGRLEHPAIVPVHELSVDDEGYPFFVMKRLTGTTLEHILASPEEERPTRQRLLRAFADVCLAVEFAHTREVIHRDLKPSNIMLGDFGEVYVLDWGVARLMGEPVTPETTDRETPPGETEAGAILGTVGYMPPEQLRAEAVDARADVYALGCTLYEILAGAPLHKRGQLTAAFDDYDARPSVRAPERDIPPELDALCVAATAAELEHRTASARALGEGVQRYLDGDRDTARRERLAAEQLDLARAALAADDEPVTLSSSIRRPIGDARRRAAMQHASRALALDPNATEAANLVGRLILEPSPETPREVASELEMMDIANLRDQAKIGVIAFLITLGFVPVVMWVGIRDPLHVSLFAGAALLNATIASVLARSTRRLSNRLLYLIVAAGVIMVATVSRVFTPFLVTPGVAAALMLSFCLHPRFGRWWLLGLVVSTGAIVPWLLELAGVFARTMKGVDGQLVLYNERSALLMPQSEIALALYTVALVIMVGAVARTTARTLREARRIAHLQAWHLRQLVPTLS